MKFTSVLIPLLLVLLPTIVIGEAGNHPFSGLEPLIKESDFIVVAQVTDAVPTPVTEGFAITQFDFVQSIKGNVPAGTNSVMFLKDLAYVLLEKDLQKQQRVVLFLKSPKDQMLRSVNSLVALPIRTDFDLTRIRGQRPESALQEIARDYLDSKEVKPPKLKSVLSEILNPEPMNPFAPAFQLQPSLQLQPAEKDGVDIPDRPH